MDYPECFPAAKVAKAGVATLTFCVRVVVSGALGFALEGELAISMELWLKVRAENLCRAEVGVEEAVWLEWEVQEERAEEEQVGIWRMAAEGLQSAPQRWGHLVEFERVAGAEALQLCPSLAVRSLI